MPDDASNKGDAILERAAEIMQILTGNFSKEMEGLVSAQRAIVERLFQPVLRPSVTKKPKVPLDMLTAQAILNCAAAIAVGEHKRKSKISNENLLPALKEFLSTPKKVRDILNEAGIDIGVSQEIEPEL